MRSFICKLVYWIMLKLYVFILWALLPLLTMGKGILIQNVVIFDGKSEKTVTGNVWIEDNAIRKVSAEPIVAGAEVEVIDGRGKFLMPGLIDAHWHAYLAANTMVDLLTAHASYTQLRAGEEAGQHHGGAGDDQRGRRGGLPAVRQGFPHHAPLELRL